jgi:exopolyphosphatase / guanosine-5'-triphosphate,3'-diphosphate pyrophosphatase
MPALPAHSSRRLASSPRGDRRPPRGGEARRSMRIAAIDIGSNSIHMIVAEADVEGGITTLWRMKEMVGLGRETFPARAISRETIERAMAILARFQQAAQQRQCERICAVATSAVREASNGGDFIERIGRSLGMEVRVISGREEARLIYLGVRHAIPLKGGPHLIVDIGGGSVEFIIGDRVRPLLLASRKLGAARMTAQFIKSDKITDAERAALLEHYENELAPIIGEIKRLKPIKAIGTSGTLENLAAMSAPPEDAASGSNGATSGAVNGNGQVIGNGSGTPIPRPRFIEKNAFGEMFEKLLRAGPKQRAAMHGLDEGRRDQIVAGALLVRELLRHLKLRRIEICPAALREGILVDYLSRHLPDLAIRQQIPDPRMRSVIALARRCTWHKSHSDHVARLTMRLFDDTRTLHGLGTPERELIEYGALLHDIGWHIARAGHHKHSMYLIRHGDLKNFAPEEIEIIAHIARYHRKSAPKQKHESFAALSPRARKIVCTGAALLRLGDGLDRSHANVVRDLRCRVDGKEVKCTVKTRWDAQLEIWGARRKRQLFEKVFKRPIVFEIAR